MLLFLAMPLLLDPAAIAADTYAAALREHRAGHPAEALRLARTLVPVKDDVPFLRHMMPLVADCERRLARGERPPLDLATATLAQLIDHLDEIDTAELEDHPIVLRLAGYGDAAVSAVLALEHDPRLLRAYRPRTQGWPPDSLMPVGEVSWEVMQAVVGARGFLDPQRPGALAAWWREHGGRPPVERWRAILASDEAGEAAWRSAMAAVARAGARAPGLSEMAARRALDTFHAAQDEAWLGNTLLAWDREAGSQAMASLGAQRFDDVMRTGASAAERHRAARVFARTMLMRFESVGRERGRRLAAAYLEILRSLPRELLRESSAELGEPWLRDRVAFAGLPELFE